MPKRLTQEEFIRRAKEVHGDKYDYSKVEYSSMNENICIICKKHRRILAESICSFKRKWVF